MSNRIEDRARKIVEPFLEENGCQLWDVVFEKEGAMHYLRILFDKKNSALNMDECEKLTPPLNKLIDAQDFINQVDIIEIGSPGTTRRLRHKEHFNYCMNKSIRVMRRLDNGKTETITGILMGYKGFDEQNRENKSITLIENPNSKEMPKEISLKKCIRITQDLRKEELEQ